MLGGVIRFLWGPHPSGDGKLTTLSVNMATGAITGSGLSGKNIFFRPVEANEGAVQDSDLTWDYPALPAGQRRRFFYRERDGHLRAQWATGDEDAAVYKYAERIPAAPADSFDGLRTTPTPGYALAPHRTQHSYAATVEFGCVLASFPASPSASVDVMRKFAASNTGGWYLRIGTDGRVTVALSRTDLPTTPYTYTFAGTVPGLLGATTPFGLKVVATVDDGGFTRVRLSYSADGGTTWTLHDANPASGSVLTLRQSTDPVTLGQGSSVTTLTFLSAWVAADGVLVIDEKFTGPGGWPAHTATHVDAVGQSWELVGDALVGTTTPPAADTYVDHEMGVAGPRIGHGAAANYIAGGCIVTNPDGSTRAVVTCHRDPVAEESYLLVWKRSSTGVWKSTELYRTSEVLARPYQPRGTRSPVGLFVSVIRNYGQGENEFTVYESDALAFAPV